MIAVDRGPKGKRSLQVNPRGFQDVSAMYMSRLEEAASAVRSRDLRRYNGIDDALVHLDRIAHDTITFIASGLRVLGSIPRRVKELTWVEVQTHKYEDFIRDVVCFRDGPQKVRASVAAIEHIMSEIEAKVAKSKPTRQFLEPYDDSKRPERQIKADSSYDPFSPAGR